MLDRLAYLWPEIVLFATTCVVMVMGLSRNYRVRKSCALVTGVGLAVAGVHAFLFTPHSDDLTASMGQLLLPNLARFSKTMIAGVGLLLLLVLAGTVDRREEEAIAAGKARFDPLRSNRAEFYSFFLFSLTGLMLCADADDLIWLFLALELTSLPTYIMVTISSAGNRSREAGVKYFFLGALGAAVFLYGFALIYGGTGSTNLNAIHAAFVEQQASDSGINGIAMAGVLLSLIGICFKIAAVPMHFYTADVYEGAAAPVSAFLAFVPKTAGFLAILLLCATVGWDVPRSGGVGGSLPDAVRLTLWVIAALTMAVGNTLAILQTSIKRILAYSSIAHSGYMLVGVIAGPGNGTFTNNGVSAVLFYLLSYGVMNLGAFAVIAALERTPGPDGEPREIETVDDLRGLWKTRPMLAGVMVLSSLSLLGMPPLLGFFGKLPLFTSGIAAREIPLVVWLAINSAVAAFYYLRLVAAPLLENAGPTERPPSISPFRGRSLAALLSGVGIIALAVVANVLMQATQEAGQYQPTTGASASAEKLP